MKSSINFFILLLPIALHAGNHPSQPKKPLSVKIMVEIIKQTTNPDSNAVTREPLAHVYNIYNEASDSAGLGSFDSKHNQPSDDLQYSIPVFMCSFSNVNGIETCRIDFEAIHNPKPRKEEHIEEDLDTLMENDEVESRKRTDECLRVSTVLLNAFQEPIAQDNRAFSLDEFQEYKTRLPNIIVKAGAYSMSDK